MSFSVRASLFTTSRVLSSPFQLDMSSRLQGSAIYTSDGLQLYARRDCNAEDAISHESLSSSGRLSGTVVLVADRMLRRGYLGMPTGGVLDDFPAISYCALEAVGRAGEAGCQATDVHFFRTLLCQHCRIFAFSRDSLSIVFLSLLQLGAAILQPPKNVFTFVNRLETLRLVFRDQRTHHQRDRFGNRLWLQRFRVADNDQAALLQFCSDDGSASSARSGADAQSSVASTSDTLLPRAALASRSVLTTSQQDLIESTVLVPTLLPIIQQTPQQIMWEDELMVLHVRALVCLPLFFAFLCVA